MSALVFRFTILHTSELETIQTTRKYFLVFEVHKDETWGLVRAYQALYRYILISSMLYFQGHLSLCWNGLT